MMKKCYKKPWSGGNCFVTKGIEDGFFSVIPHKYRNKLMKIISRISEMSYRRGCQQGVVFASKYCKKFNEPRSWEMLKRVEDGDLRFNYSPDDSPWHVHINLKSACGGTTAMERLDMEYGDVLLRVGLYVVEKKKCSTIS